MKSNAIYTTSDAGLNRFFGKIYGLVGIGVGLLAVISYLMLFPLSHLFVNILMNYSWIYMAAIFVELALVFLASGAARRNTPAALPLDISDTTRQIAALLTASACTWILYIVSRKVLTKISLKPY